MNYLFVIYSKKSFLVLAQQLAAGSNSSYVAAQMMERRNLDQKKRALVEELSRLRTLSNATSQMTDKVNDILLKRLRTAGRNKKNSYDMKNVSNNRFRSVKYSDRNNANYTVRSYVDSNGNYGHKDEYRDQYYKPNLAIIQLP